MSTTLRYDRRIAKRNHKRRCEMSGLPIEKGDRYFIGAFVDDGDFCSIKTHSILQDMAHESMKDNDEDGWDPWEASEYLLGWLRKHLGKPLWERSEDSYGGHLIDNEEVKLCHEAALEYWKGNNNE